MAVSLEQWRASLLRFTRFGVVGASGVVVNEGLLYVGHGRLRLPLLLASVIAIECAIISNYLLNDRWTFHHPHPAWRRFWRFNAVSLVGMAVNLAALALLTRFTALAYWAANPIAVVAAFAVNYLLNVYWTYGAALSALDPASGSEPASALLPLEGAKERLPS